MTVVPVVTCRVCEHSAPLYDMSEHHRHRVFDWQPHEVPKDKRWVCKDQRACVERFKEKGL